MALILSTRQSQVSARSFSAVGHTCLSSEKRLAPLPSVHRPLLTQEEGELIFQLTFKETGVGSGSRALMCPPGLHLLYIDMKKGSFY